MNIETFFKNYNRENKSSTKNKDKLFKNSEFNFKSIILYFTNKVNIYLLISLPCRYKDIPYLAR